MAEPLLAEVAIEPVVLGTVGMTDIVRYAGASGDFNPIHHDPEFAVAAGNPGVFAMGMMHAGWVGAWIESQMSEEFIGSFEVRFVDRVWPSDTLKLQRTEAPGSTTSAFALYRAPGELAAIFRVGGGDGPVSAEPGGELVVGPYRWIVEQGAVRDFRQAIHSAGDAGVAPITFPVTVHRARPSPDLIDALGFAVPRLLHGSTRFDYASGLLRVGEVLHVTQRIGKRREKVGRRGGRMQTAEVVTEAVDGTGAIRVRETMVLLELAAPPEAPATASEASTEASPTPAWLREDPPALLGSRDPDSGTVVFPPRELSVDGLLRCYEPVVLSSRGVLHSFTEHAGTWYGQVDLNEGVRVQTVLDAGPHAISGEYRLAVRRDGATVTWRFEHA